MVWANFKVRPTTLALLPRYMGDALPSVVVKSRLRRIYWLDGVKFYRSHTPIGDGASGTCYRLDSSNTSQSWALKVYHPNRPGDIIDDEWIAQSGMMIPLKRVANEEGEAIMPLGKCLLPLVTHHSLRHSEVDALAHAVLALQRELIIQYNALYTDVKLDNLLLFKSPDAEGHAAIVFCDHGGCTPCNGRGVATYPPPGCGTSGYVDVTYGFERNEWTWAIYWGGLVVVSLYDLLSHRMTVFNGNPAVCDDYEERMTYLAELQQELSTRGLCKFSTWLDPDPDIREHAVGPPPEW